MTCRPLSSLFRLGLATVVLALLGACAQPVAPSAMVPDVTGINVGPTSVYRGAISVGQVSGGHPPRRWAFPRSAMPTCGMHWSVP